MTHRRTLIRGAIVGILKDAATPAGDRVFGSRVEPLWDVQMPLILVYARDESSQGLGTRPKPMERRPRVSIEARVSLTENVDDALDEVAEAIEQAINADFKLRNTAVGCNLVSSEIDVAYEGEQPIAAIRLTYEVFCQE